MHKSIPILLVLMAIGVLLLGSGMSGEVVFNQYVKEACRTNADCAQPYVCCLFSSGGGGVCNTEDLCSAVAALGTSEAAPTPPQVENYAQILIGAGIIIFCIAALYFVSKRAEEPQKT
ncbi:MAG: hypothetical protein V1725_07520 [archaeon]